MKVGLINIEPKVFNTAYMQIAEYHKVSGDTVEWWTPLTHRSFDAVYCSSLFTDTDKSDVPADAICGGTGFDVHSRLSVDMENCQFDYSIYPKCKTSFVWFTKGCNRNCPWCVVPEKEGRLHKVQRKLLNPKGRYVTIMDNSFFASPGWRDAIQWLGDMPVDIQGIDVRTLNEEKCRALDGLRRWKNKQFKIAWDDPRDESVLRCIKFALEFIPPRKLMCYVLIGFDSSPDEDLHRVETLRRLKIDPYVMPYDRSSLYQRAFARWVNHKAIFKSVKWPNYQARVMKQEKQGKGWGRRCG